MNKTHDRAGEVESVPEAKVKKSRSVWLLWLIPLGAAALCVWFVYHDFIASGPLITIYFQSAEGLEAGNTPIKFRGAEVGEVNTIELRKGDAQVKVTARLVTSAKDLARAGAIFWIVRPEVKLGSISGLRTIISGEYITVQPGTGAPTNTFVASEKAPVPPEPQALRITLVSPDLDSVREQTPVFYRGIQVGEVLGYQLGDTGDEVVIRARIRPEYAPLVRLNSKFWNAGGINVHFGLLRGAEISAESPQTLLSGGIEFATPPEVQRQAPNGTTFVLYEKPEDIWKRWAPNIPLKLPAQAPPTVTPTQFK